MLNFCDFIQVYVFTTNHHLKKKKKCKIQNTENGYSNGLFTNVRLMTSFLTYHQQPTDYTIERQQHHNGIKNINVIVLL